MNGTSINAETGAEGREERDAPSRTRFLAARRRARCPQSFSGWLPLFTLLAFFTGSSAPGRDAAVWLNNYDANCPIIDADDLAFGDDFGVQVWGGPVGGVLRPVVMETSGTSIVKLKEPGFFNAGIGIIPAFPDDQNQADFIIRVWKGAPAYELAGIVMQSARWTQTTGAYPLSSNSTPPAALQIPEPLLWLEQAPFALLTTVLTPVRGAGKVELYPPSPYSEDLPATLRPWPPPGPVSLHAVPDPGYRFVNWIGSRPDPNMGLPIKVDETNEWFKFELPMGTAVIVATFEPGPWLKVNATYGGWVTNQPSGTHFTPGTAVKLTAIPNPDFAFSSWSGDVVSTNPVITINMVTNTTLTALFRPLFTPVLLVRPENGDGVLANRFGFTLLGEVGQRYQIERSPDLAHWTLFAQIAALTNLTQVSDTTISNRPYQYYRARKTE